MPIRLSLCPDPGQVTSKVPPIAPHCAGCLGAWDMRPWKPVQADRGDTPTKGQ